jgi:aminoglycoside phosphotransferase (APT) family kinase protein
MVGAEVSDPCAALAQQLGALLPQVLPGTTGVGGLQRLSAGATLQTWAFEALGAGAPQPLILRRSPPGGLRGAESLALADEAALLRALTGAAPALRPVLAEVVHVLDPAGPMGDGFVMRRVAGETIPRKIQRDAPFAGARERLVGQLGQVLAALHGVDPGVLPALPWRGLQATLDKLEARCATLPRPNPVFAFALRWLQTHRPDPAGERLVLVHGDYRLGNVIVTPDAPSAPGGLAAVLDWEIAHLGDPAEDLAWICLPPWRFGRIALPVAGLGTREQLFTAYQAADGQAVDAARVRWWQAAGSLRWGLGCAGMREWFDSGRDASVERAMIARRVSENEIDLLRLIAPRREPQAFWPEAA